MYEYITICFTGSDPCIQPLTAFVAWFSSLASPITCLFTQLRKKNSHRFDECHLAVVWISACKKRSLGVTTFSFGGQRHPGNLENEWALITIWIICGLFLKQVNVSCVICERLTKSVLELRSSNVYQKIKGWVSLESTLKFCFHSIWLVLGTYCFMVIKTVIRAKMHILKMSNTCQNCRSTTLKNTSKYIFWLPLLGCLYVSLALFLGLTLLAQTQPSLEPNSNQQ